MEITQKLSSLPPTQLQDGYWAYYNLDGLFLGYVIRKNKKNGGKSCLPWIFQDGKWVNQWWPEETGVPRRPIYRAEYINKYPDKPILIVEGEKTADKASELLPDYLVLSWMGGCAAVGKQDWSVIEGRKIYLWPDNDKPGIEAMEKLKAILKPIASDLYLINPEPLGLEKGWDLADFDEDHGTIDWDMVLMAMKEARNILTKFERIDTETFPDLSERDRPLNTTDNIEHLLNHYKIKIKYNLMTNLPEFIGLDKKFSSQNEIDCYLTEISNLCIKNNVPKIDLYPHINLIAERNQYHPAREFIESKPWDGISRINELLETITSPKQELANKLIFRWLVSCVAALYLPNGIASEGALVLQGLQRVGKTYWLLKLVPESFRHLVKEAVSMSVSNKDDVMKSTNVWIAELGEIESTFKKSDVNELKNFITASYDEYRAPFARLTKKYTRRTIYYGSVNSHHFLADETGNRRFWTVPVTHINYDHTIDMQQFWAEIKTCFDNGESYRLTSVEHDLLNESNQDHECINPIKELLLSKYDWDSPSSRWMTATQIILDLDLIPDKSKTNNLSNILRSLNIDSRKTMYGRQYAIPLRKIID